MQQSGDVGRAEESAASVETQIAAETARLNTELAAIAARFDARTLPLTTAELRPRKTDIKPRLIAILWTPHWRDTSGRLSPAST